MKMKMIRTNSIFAIGLFAVLFLIGFGIRNYLYAPTHVIAIDVNPSIELHTNRLGQVVSIDPVNEDAAELMAGYELKGKSMEDVIEDIVDRMIFFGYISTNENNQILLTSEEDEESRQLLSKAEAVISSYIEKRELNVAVLQQEIDIDEDDIEIAHDNEISVGKMAFIQKLLQSDGTVTKDEMISLSIKDLVQYYESKGIVFEDVAENNTVSAGDQTSANSLDTIGIKVVSGTEEEDDEDSADATSGATRKSTYTTGLIRNTDNEEEDEDSIESEDYEDSDDDEDNDKYEDARDEEDDEDSDEDEDEDKYEDSQKEDDEDKYEDAQKDEDDEDSEDSIKYENDSSEDQEDEDDSDDDDDNDYEDDNDHDSEDDRDDND